MSFNGTKNKMNPSSQVTNIEAVMENRSHCLTLVAGIRKFSITVYHIPLL